MQTQAQLSRQRVDLIAQIAQLGPMRMGTVSEQMLRTRRADGSVYQRGPYLTYTFKQGGKTRGKHLRDAAEAEVYRRQIQTWQRYQAISTQLVEVSQRLADLEAQEGRGGSKKNSRR